MRVGSLVFATDSGLGVLARSFYDHGVVTDVVVVRHRHFHNHDEWYPGAERVQGTNWSRERREILQFCEKMDVMLFFETPYYWDILEHCRTHNIRTYLMPMYECMAVSLPAQPHRFLCPSLLDLRYYPERSEFIPVPVEVPWRKRERARVFVHNAGHGGLLGRNGTAELLDALCYVKSPVKVILRSQKNLGWDTRGRGNTIIESRVGTCPFSELYGEGDVFLFPEKFNGLSLPLQEARAAGMLVMTTDRFPMNTWLPNGPLLPVSGYTTKRISGRCNEFDCAVLEPKVMAAKIDEYYDQDISDYSEGARGWAASMSWETLKPRYLEALSK